MESPRAPIQFQSAVKSTSKIRIGSDLFISTRKRDQSAAFAFISLRGLVAAAEFNRCGLPLGLNGFCLSVRRLCPSRSRRLNIENREAALD